MNTDNTIKSLWDIHHIISDMETLDQVDILFSSTIKKAIEHKIYYLRIQEEKKTKQTEIKNYE